MTDVHTREQRSLNMSAIRAKNTKPEIKVRSLLHSLGYRFRLHSRDLPGTPDIVLRRHKLAIFINGCFWHLHDCKYGRVKPATRPEFWEAKRQMTAERDRRNLAALKSSGWHVVVIWECWTKNDERLRHLIQKVFDSVACAPPTTTASDLHPKIHK